jgi:2-dehydro-3-deoxyphosphogluconate aldolase/(4S)-4-hydroxy-2-oxoglutarate aldolase
VTGGIMPRLLKDEVVTRILDQGLIPVFYNKEFDVAKNVVQACIEGGSGIVEFTNRGENAIIIFKKLVKWCREKNPDLLLGAGTIIDAETASIYIENGADYIVGPSFNLEIARLCNKNDILYIPGCQTPTEILEAEANCAKIIKLFPAIVVSPSFVKAVLGPMPRTLLMPSGGIALDKGIISEWIQMGAVALNMGSALLKKELIMESKFNEISTNVEKCIKWITEAKALRDT